MVDRFTLTWQQKPKHRQAFTALVGCLRAGLIDRAPSRFRTAAWDDLIKAARLHWVTPSWAWCLRSDTSVPAPLQNYFEAVLRLNRKRNERICDALAKVVAALNAIDVEPTLLKGAAHLASGLYPAPEVRLMSDLDILVPAARAHDVIAAMAEAGFAPDEQFLPTAKHLPPMHHDRYNIHIEVHTALLHDSNAPPFLMPAWVKAHTRPFAFRGLRVGMPTPTLLVAHNVIHDQLSHGRYANRLVEVRQLLDLALLRARYDSEIDWRELDRLFGAAGIGPVLATYLRYDEVLFGQPMPALASAPRPHAATGPRTGFEPWLRCRIAVRFMAAWLGNFAVSRIRDPRRLLRLFDGRAWRKGLRHIRNAATRQN